MNLLHWLVFFALAAPLVQAQAVKGTLLGTVTDSTAAVVPGAKVSITEVNTGIGRAVEANQNGYYVFANLESGVYRVQVEHTGFKTAVRDRVEVLVNTTIRVDVELQPGTVSETVDVQAEAAVLQTDRSDTGRKIETRQLSDMPLPYNRNFQGLLNLVPGAVRAFRPHSEFFNSQDSLSTRVNGQTRLANNVQVEGIDDNHRSGLLTILIPPIEALAAVDITTSNYEAELGRAGGAVTNVTLRSGTNNLHGSVFEFNRTDRLASRNVFAQSKAHTVYNQFGFTIGGPVARNRTFFFGDYQSTRDRRGDINRATIPTPVFREGDLRESPTTIYDPATGNPDGTSRQPFADKRIPGSRISPIARKLLAFIPAPTFQGLQTNFEKATTRNKDTPSFDVKIDHQFNTRNNLSFRYSFMEPKIYDPGLYGIYGGPKITGGFDGTGANRTQSSAINYTRIFGPSFITEARFGFARYLNVTQQEDYGKNLSADAGIPGINLDESTSGLTTINIDGYAGPVVGHSANQPWKRGETNFNLVNNWTKIISNHTIKWGVEVRRLRDDLKAGIFNPRGQWSFRAGPTARNGDPQTSFGNSFAGLLLDQPAFYQRDLPSLFSSIRQTPVFTYVQDKWQITKKLTVDLGLRHELWLPPTPQFPGGFSNYDPLRNALVLAGIGPNPSNLGRETIWRNFAPRFGVAYRASEKTVLRGGYGISAIPFPDNSYAFNFPVLQNNAFNAPNTYRAAGTLAAGFPPPIVAVIPPDGVIQNAPDNTYFTVPLDLKEGYLQSWNLAVQRSLPWKFVFEAAYVGNHGVGILGRRNLNAGLTPGAGSAGQPLFQRFRRLSDTTTWVPVGNGYHSLQVKFDRRFSEGFLLTTAYTFGKAIDLSNDNAGFFNQINFRVNRGRADTDRTHTFVQSYIWELPFGSRERWLKTGLASRLLGDWQVNGIFTAQTGDPLNITFSAATLNAPGNSNRPNISARPEIYGRVGRGEKWLDVSVFSAPPPATFGAVGRNVLTGPGFVNLDFSVFRKFPLAERLGLEFRMESFNFTNTPHFNNPNMSFGSAGFGEVTTAVQDQRQIQFGLKLMW
ncbi:MAG: TonB-dependent receptor [Acidobacteria bacterium]|nr:TonB-dependent receptor [Acidobacteriota bacterium]